MMIFSHNSNNDDNDNDVKSMKIIMVIVMIMIMNMFILTFILITTLSDTFTSMLISHFDPTFLGPGCAHTDVDPHHTHKHT